METPEQALAGSESQKSGDLTDTLHRALKGCTTEFSGSFYHCSTDSNAPNPGLNIEGLGLIGLPLTEQIAQAVVSRAARAPFGKGTETLVDTTVRDTWEIEPQHVSFGNPKWNEYVDRVATQTVWTALGVAPYTTKPRCELYKLLLYQPGSHFLPHQDTLKTNGMFATIVLVLPSAFEGGEVHVSHAGETKVLDVSFDSAFSTSVLAWYTDVVHEVKPVTSGYRLALSYNLVHTSPNTPQPCLPDANSAQTALRQCLQKWKDNGFLTVPEDTPLTVSLLDHQYSTSDLDRGLEALKGKDAHTLSQLIPIAKELGFAVCLGNLTKTEKGYPEDDYGESLEMQEVEEESYDVTHLVCIDGAPDTHFKDFSLDRECLVPEDAFSGVAPDDRDYEGYQGNHAGTMEQWYRRSVLILFRKEDEIDIAISINGANWALERLKLDKHREDTEKIVAALLRFSGSYNADKDGICITVMDTAIAWSRVDWWNEAVPRCEVESFVSTANADFTAALAVFGLNAIKPGLTELVKRSRDLRSRFAIIKEIRSKVDDSTDSIAWIEDLEKEAIFSYCAADVKDIPILVDIVQRRGAGVLEASILPNIPKSGVGTGMDDPRIQAPICMNAFRVVHLTILLRKIKCISGGYDFLVALANALDEYRQTAETSGDQEKPALAKLIRECVILAISQWTTLDSATTYYRSRHDAGTVTSERLPGLIDLCFNLDQADLCTILYGSVPKDTSFTIHFELAKALQVHLAKRPAFPEPTRASLSNIVRASVQAAIPKWEEGLTITSSSDWRAAASQSSTKTQAPNVKTNRICELVDMSFAVGDLHLCVALLNTLLQSLADEPRRDARLKEVFIPLVPQLKAVAGKHGQLVTNQPFASFFKIVVSAYLSSILCPLIPKTLTAVLPTRNAGCGHCSECKQLKAFINNASPELHFQAHITIRKHLEAEITKARIHDIVTTQTIKYSSPHTLLLTKRPELVVQLAWKEAQAAGSKFVKNVGSDQELKVIMGERYDDVGMAMRGTKVFAVKEDFAVSEDVELASPSSGEAGSGDMPSAATSGSSSAAGISVVASTSAGSGVGKKRKRGELPKNTIAVIDLT